MAPKKVVHNHQHSQNQLLISSGEAKLEDLIKMSDQQYYTLAPP